MHESLEPSFVMHRTRCVFEEVQVLRRPSESAGEIGEVHAISFEDSSKLQEGFGVAGTAKPIPLPRGAVRYSLPR
jgi:hypothetical protein